MNQKLEDFAYIVLLLSQSNSCKEIEANFGTNSKASSHQDLLNPNEVLLQIPLSALHVLVKSMENSVGGNFEEAWQIG